MWNRILPEKDLISLAQCNDVIHNGKVVTWSESYHQNLWKWSNITMEKFNKGADRALCGKIGYFEHKILLLWYIIMYNIFSFDINKNLVPFFFTRPGVVVLFGSVSRKKKSWNGGNNLQATWWSLASANRWYGK